MKWLPGCGPTGERLQFLLRAAPLVAAAAEAVVVQPAPAWCAGAWAPSAAFVQAARASHLWVR